MLVRKLVVNSFGILMGLLNMVIYVGANKFFPESSTSIVSICFLVINVICFIVLTKIIDLLTAVYFNYSEEEEEVR